MVIFVVWLGIKVVVEYFGGLFELMLRYWCYWVLVCVVIVLVDICFVILLIWMCG